MTTNGRKGGGTTGDADRDPRLDRLYRETAQEGPPARLDAAILAAARREVGARPRAVSARLRAWRVPISIAAVVVLSVSLVTLVREEGGGQLGRPPAVDLYSKSAETAPVPPAAVSPISPEAAKAPTSAAARDDAALGATASAKVAEEASRRAAEASGSQSAAPEPHAPSRAATPTPQPFQAPSATREQRPALSADQAAGMGAPTPFASNRSNEMESPAVPTAIAPSPAARMIQRDRAAAGDAAGSISAVPPPAAGAPAEKPRTRLEARSLKGERPPADSPSVAALLKEFDPQPPEKWLEKIEALKREGRNGEADDMLAEFKRRFPDHPLPPGLR